MKRFCKTEQSILRHFIFINNPTFSFRPCNNPNSVHSHTACGQEFCQEEKGRWLGCVTPECHRAVVQTRPVWE